MLIRVLLHTYSKGASLVKSDLVALLQRKACFALGVCALLRWHTLQTFKGTESEDKHLVRHCVGSVLGEVDL